MVSLKQMKYENEMTELKTLADSYYKGFHFLILNMRGSHPCAYIEIPEGHSCYGKTDKEPWWIGKQEVTFGRSCLGSILTDTWVIGWDYAHIGDKTIYDDYGKKYKTYEILLDIFSAIEDIK